MARELFRSLVGSVVLTAAVSNAWAVWPPPLGLSVDPPAPSDADPLDIRVVQTLGDTGYSVIGQDLGIAGNDINLWVLVQDLHTHPDRCFAQVVTDYSADFSDIGPLAAGLYNVNAELWMTPWPYTWGGWLFKTATLALEVSYLGASLPGDYNGNGTVDAADYCVWRDNLNTSAHLPNDDTPGAVTEADVIVWRNHFGESSGSGSLALSTAVPEPRSAILLAVGATAAAGTALRRKPRHLAG